jgi:hypothetical protein
MPPIRFKSVGFMYASCGWVICPLLLILCLQHLKNGQPPLMSSSSETKESSSELQFVLQRQSPELHSTLRWCVKLFNLTSIISMFIINSRDEVNVFFSYYFTPRSCFTCSSLHLHLYASTAYYVLSYFTLCTSLRALNPRRLKPI